MSSTTKEKEKLYNVNLTANEVFYLSFLIGNNEKCCDKPTCFYSNLHKGVETKIVSLGMFINANSPGDMKSLIANLIQEYHRHG